MKKQILLFLSALLLLAGCFGDSGEPTLPPPPTRVPTQAADVTPDANGGEGDTAVTPVATSTLPGEEGDDDAVATPTLAPTATVIEADPALDPPLTTLTAAPLPATNRDLLFIADGALRFWNKDTRQVETLLSGGTPTAERPRESTFMEIRNDVTDYVVNDNGRFLVAAKLTQNDPLTDTAKHRYQLLSFNLDSRQSRILAEDILNLRNIALSPNGEHLLFTARPADLAEDEFGWSVYLLNTGDGQPPRRLADCPNSCYDIAWHPENNLVVWGDGEALWLYNLAADDPEVLQQNQTGTPENTVVYTPHSWASNGRFLMLWKGAYEGASRSVLDVPGGVIMDVPDTFTYSEQFPVEVSWMQDDRLLLLRPGYGSLEGGNPTLQLWRVNVDAAQVALEEEKVLASGAYGAMGSRHLEDGRFAYALTSPDPDPTNGFYHLISLSEDPERVNSILPAASALETTWSPDGSGAVTINNGRTFYAPADGDALYDVTPVIGDYGHHFTWQPPRP